MLVRWKNSRGQCTRQKRSDAHVVPLSLGDVGIDGRADWVNVIQHNQRDSLTVANAGAGCTEDCG